MLARKPAAQCTHSWPPGTSSRRSQQAVQRDVRRADEAAGGSLVVAAHVQHPRLRLVGEGAGEVGEGPPRIAAGAGGRSELRDRPDRGARGTVDADPDQLALGVGDLLMALADQREGCAPRDDPAQVGRELLAEGDPDAAGEVVGGVGGAVAQVDHPLTGGDALGEGVGVHGLGR